MRNLAYFFTRSIAEIYKSSIEYYNKFFYMLITFSGAATVLSLTLLNTLSNNHFVKTLNLETLILSWKLFGATIILSVLRIYIQMARSYTLSVRMVALESVIKEYEVIFAQNEAVEKERIEFLDDLNKTVKESMREKRTKEYSRLFNECVHKWLVRIKCSGKILKELKKKAQNNSEKDIPPFIRGIEDLVKESGWNRTLKLIDFCIIALFISGVFVMLLFILGNIR